MGPGEVWSGSGSHDLRMRSMSAIMRLKHARSMPMRIRASCVKTSQ